MKAQNFSELARQKIWLMLFIVFLGGVLTSLTPCVLPIIPITLLIIGVRAESTWRRNSFLSFSLVLGLALTYAFLGVVAVAFGQSLGFLFQQKWLIVSLAIGFFLLSLSMFGLYELHLPQGLRHRLHQVKGHGVLGAFVSGGVAGLLAAPCAGPVVGALLLFVATTQSYGKGFGLLFIFALGMGLLFLVIGTGYGTLQYRFRAGAISIGLKRFLGVLLLLGSLFYLNTVVPFDKVLTRWTQGPDPVAWVKTETEGLTLASQLQKPILIDFYADWCAPCKKLELGFFRKKEVVELLQQMVPVRVDATFSGRPEVEAIIKKYGVVAWPTIIFLDPQGHRLEDLTVVSYHPKLIFENMRRALQFMVEQGPPNDHRGLEQ